jgi:hypothetical protein
MVKIIIGSVLMTLLVLEPLVGYLIFEYFLRPSEATQMVMGFVWVIAALFRLMMYGSLVVSGYRELKISHPFEI